MNILENHPLSKYTTFQIGGPADYFVDAGSSDEVLESLKWANEQNMPVFVFGGGSNLLFDDAGFRGLVIRVKSDQVVVDGLDVADEGTITADAGVSMAKVVKAAADNSLTGIEAWNGLPGTVGGAVIGNAGCFGVEVKDVLESAEIFVPGSGAGNGVGGKVKKVGKEFFNYSYRHSDLKNPAVFDGQPAVVLSATFKLKIGEREKILEKMKEIARSRIQKQPPGSSTGSFFKNPSTAKGEFAGKSAGWLIEQCGLKGKVLGKAKISEQHGNFFINTGGATSAEILALADLATKAVEEKFGIKLQKEVVVIPEIS